MQNLVIINGLNCNRGTGIERIYFQMQSALFHLI